MRHICICALTIVLLVGRSLQARPPDGWDWNHQGFESPQSLNGSLDWRHGKEQIVLNIELPQQPGAGWLLELPCAPADVEVGHVPEPKPFGGWTLAVALHGKLNAVGRAALATQIYPLVYELLHPSLGWSAEIPGISPSRETTLDGVRCSSLQVSTAADLQKQVEKLGIDLRSEDLIALSS